MRKLVSRVLEEAGHEVIQAGDGCEALTVARAESADLVITDVNMPNMNGIDLISELRSLKAYTFTPILVLTTESRPDFKRKAKERGATGWIHKPFTQDVLTTTVAKVLDD